MGVGIPSYRRSVACRSNGEKVKAKYRLAGESQLAVHQYRLAPITMNGMLALSNVFASVANKISNTPRSFQCVYRLRHCTIHFHPSKRVGALQRSGSLSQVLDSVVQTKSAFQNKHFLQARGFLTLKFIPQGFFPQHHKCLVT